MGQPILFFLLATSVLCYKGKYAEGVKRLSYLGPPDGEESYAHSSQDVGPLFPGVE